MLIAKVRCSLLGITTLSIPVMAAPQESCVKTSAGDVVCGELLPKSYSKPTRTDSSETLQTAVDNNPWYPSMSPIWELKSCSRMKKDVRCTFSVSNNEDYGGYHMKMGLTKIVDAAGNEYRAKFMQIGAKSASSGAVEINMTKGARYKTVIDFEAVPNSVSERMS
jgi:hypothetical protein